MSIVINATPSYPEEKKGRGRTSLDFAKYSKQLHLNFSLNNTYVQHSEIVHLSVPDTIGYKYDRILVEYDCNNNNSIKGWKAPVHVKRL